MKKILNKFRYIAGLLSVAIILTIGGCSTEDSQKFLEYAENPEYLQEILQPDEDNISNKDLSEEQIEEVFDAPSDDISEGNVTTETDDSFFEYFYSFRTEELYDSHYEKHRNEFGDITKEEYLEMANSLINRQSDSVENKYDEDGDYMYYDISTNEFLVLSKDGYIRTFFKPTAGIDYWNRQ